MKRTLYPLAALALVAACDDNANPIIPGAEVEAELDAIVDDAAEITPDETSGSDPASAAIPLTIDEILDAGTLQVDLGGDREDRGDIARTEARDGAGGFAEEFLFDADADTLTIDNLAFDGLNVYTRGANTTPASLSDVGSIAVYHGDVIVPDFLTGNPVDQQVPYVALYDESDVLITDPIPADATPEEIAAIQAAARPRTSFSIVRTGAYVGFGFGGFGYERAGDAVIAESGQATFSGDYGGLRVLSEIPELLVVEGDISIDIDFDDFNAGAGLKGEITNRQAFLPDGRRFPTFNGLNRATLDFDNPAQAQIAADAAALNPSLDLAELEDEAAAVQLPNIDFVVRGGGETIKDNGEISGEIRSRFINPASGTVEVYEEGNYFAIIAGDTTADDGGEVAGIIRVESPDSRFIGVTAQETGGFIAKR